MQRMPKGVYRVNQHGKREPDQVQRMRKFQSRKTSAPLLCWKNLRRDGNRKRMLHLQLLQLFHLPGITKRYKL